MATVIPYNNPAIADGTAGAQTIANVVQSYFDVKHWLDHLVALKGGAGGTNWAAIEASANVAAGQGQAYFNAVDVTLAGMTTAYNACAPLDALRPV
jgi:hypothetical protein